MVNDFFNFANAYVLGAWHAIWLVWPWLLGMTVIEWMLPARPTRWTTWFFNTLYIPVYLTVAGMALHLVLRLINPLVPVNIFGLSFEQLGITALLGMAFFYLLLFDFFYYWFHRAQHASSIMWRYHRFHHSDGNVAVTSATRHHWLEELIRYFFMTAPLVILVGHPETVLPWIGVVIGVDGMFIHWNTKLRFGRFTAVMVGPQYHRVHHSVESKHINTNFAVMFPVWDQLFGTQYMPLQDEFPETGVAEVISPNGWRHLLPWPSRNI